ncbi:AMP-binding protein [Cytobacillus purgationiresistens]|uniref:Long-chain acyl-CoA synthetase n=1 Tax=Cytobacillus purgationiresistens TaxID=863449 RepID=A0ABU0APF1_9BACI|nr:AMP-binding protein [Cytobacillus purgationiresistens]MDQ0272647.1 long-chain acyl-CoA synthetase [Cytobacillus purgationiresistens]
MSLNNGYQPLHYFLRHHAQVAPDKAAIIFYGFTVTYKELDDWSDRFACFLHSRGIRKGDTVALFLPNCPQYIISHFAIQKIGAIVGPCSAMFKEWELEYEVKDLCAKAIVTLDEFFPIVESVKPKTMLETVVTTSYKDFLPDVPFPDFPEAVYPKKYIPMTEDLHNIIQQYDNVCPNVDINIDEDVALIVYTSGSTGLPKGAMLTYQNALYKTRSMATVRGMNSSDVSLSVMPICHIAGMLGMNVSIYTGGTIVLLSRFSPEAVMKVIELHKITAAQTVVPMNVAIMNHPMSKQIDFRSLRLNGCTSFGMQLTESISKQWEELTGTCLFESAYGLSETHTADAVTSPETVKFGTTGKALPGTEIKILSLEEPRRELPMGQEGEIIVKNPGVFKGYLNKPQETAKTLQDGWVYTGDIGKIDHEGFLYFLGRQKEMIKCSGYSVFPEDVELMINKHHAVIESAVIGVKDPVRGESVKAFVVLKGEYEEDVTAEELILWCKEKMAAYKYPRQIELRTQLPKTGTGKLLRRELAGKEKIK